MKTMYLMKRPLDIGTFPEENKITNCVNLDYRKVRYYNAIETSTPVSKENLYKYELIETTDIELKEKNILC